MAAFAPRLSFPTLDSLPRSYFLGHHRAGLNRMKTLLPQIDLFLECRDYRVPLTSRNPLFEEHLSDKKRMIIYTKHDLGIDDKEKDKQRKGVLRKWHRPSPVEFSNCREWSVQSILELIKKHCILGEKLTGPRLMIVGMPNVGKSSMLNALRKAGVDKGKAAKVGAQPGITRGIGTSVKILDGEDESQQVYLLDTPGVFVPYVPNVESMLKLALCGSVKDTIVAPVIVADYLLYQLNLVDRSLYKKYCDPTNEVIVFLEAIARKTGRLGKGAALDLDAAALWIVQQWRNGQMGRFVLDTVTMNSLDSDKQDRANMESSVTQARKAAGQAKKQRRLQQISEI